MKKYNQLTMMLKDELKDRIDVAWHTERAKSRSAWVRKIIEEYLDEKGY